ncbi:MAG TPA: hypothetical protein VFP87_10120, partial [Chitinophagaceae bacterium]|nr:hypothetical protein [Chitinophagaceae bacterium]
FVDRMQWLKLLFNYLLFFIPFFLGALALGIVFVKYVAEIGRFYFSNLIGSGIGALLAAVLAWWFFPAALPSVTALIAVTAGLLSLERITAWPGVAITSATTAFIFFRILIPADMRLSEYKGLSQTMNLPRATIVIQKPSPYGFLQVVSADGLRYAPGLSLAFDREVLVKKAVFNNGDWYGPVDSWNAHDSFHLLDYTTMALPYVLDKRNTVLVLNAGTGLFVSHALSHHALQVDAVEPHNAVQNLFLNQLAVDNDSMYYAPQLHSYITEPRTFLSTTRKKYDLIQLPIIGPFGGGVGLYAMREEYSLTKEAFAKMWNLLKDDGVISVTAWMDYPYRNPLKMVATLGEMLDDLGVPQLSHLTAVRSWGTITCLLKKSSLTPSDTSAIRKFCRDYYFDPLLLPGVQPGERCANNTLTDSNFFMYTDELLSAKREQLFSHYGFHIRPATDDKPYFSQFLRWKSLPKLASIFGSQNVSFIELGWLISAATFLQITLLAGALIILPLFGSRQHGQRRNRLWTLIYFGGIGVGYMLLEIVLIQKFILFFGNAVYAAALTICVMLLASGAGSYYSSRFSPNRLVMQRILLIISLLLSLYAFFLPSMLGYIASFPNVIKFSIALLIVAGPAIVMGMPFPLGLRMQSLIEEKNVAWSWGVNGCMSVISAAFAALLSVDAGFSTVITVAAIAYAISMLSIYLVNKSPKDR